MGKTLLTRQLVVLLCDAQRHAAKGSVLLLPIRVPLIDIATLCEKAPPDADYDLFEEHIEATWGVNSTPVQLYRYAKGEATPGLELRVLLVCDGLDEAASQRPRVLQCLGAVLDKFPNMLCVVSTRPAGVDHEAFEQHRFTCLEMQALTPAMAEDLARRTLKRFGTPGDEVHAVLTEIRRPAYSSQCRVPIMLTLLLHVVVKHLQDARESGIEGRVLSTTEIYQRALELVLHVGDAGKRKRRQGQDSQQIALMLKTLGKPELRMQLQDLFYGLHCDQLRALEWKKVVGNEIMGTLAEAVTAGYVPLFEDLGGGKAQLVHLSYQELFVGEFMARALTNARGDEKMFESLVHSLLGADLARMDDSWWFAPILHCCALLSDDVLGAFLDVLVEKDKRAVLAP